MSTMSDVSKALVTTAEFYDKKISPAGAKMLVDVLSGYNPDALIAAIMSCSRELARFPTPADIIARVERMDGRPGPEEAWSMIPKDEYGSVVWSDEMSNAYAAAGPLLSSGDEIAARMAFKEVYERELKLARAEGRPPNWTPSFGFDVNQRTAAVQTAIEKKRISSEQGRSMCPEISSPREQKLLAGVGGDHKPDPDAIAKIRAIAAGLVKSVPEEGSDEETNQ